ncbi:heavy-metal-associated domain-containing protein [Pseudomonas sp. PDM17]|uniref:heavy-metal-associated domain-containing protein n=1 Tax=Pseudomonas sp. PDM17 TaxID=2769285 RepID=UPI0017870455|nr:heavy-metal-associated domain-containing protein [Pseudomonas sp. PDM17]MBD9502750.1 heavy-metal-associated domain-containing protein [Pseudomonas sp. PDM17]
MISIEVKDMTCGHCEATLRKAVAAVDAGAGVVVDLPARRLEIDSIVDSERFFEAVLAAGYTPEKVGAKNANANGNAVKEKRGCCCR